MTKKDQKFLFYILVSVILTLGLTMSLQPLLADWVAPNQSPPFVSGSLGMPIWNQSGTLTEYELQKVTWILDDFRVTKGGLTYFYVDTSDAVIPYVGIGTDAPEVELHVTSENPGGWTSVRIENTASADSEWELRAMDNATSDFIIWGGHEGATEDRLVINGQTGNISIGHTNPGIAKMDIYGGIHLRGSIPDPLTNPYDFVQLNVVDSGSDYSEIRWGINHVNEPGTDKFRFIWDSDPDIGEGTEVEIMTLLATNLNDGRVGINEPNPNYAFQVTGDIAYTGTLDDISDARLKEVNKEYKRGLDAIMNLNPVYYNFKKDNELNLDTEEEYVGLLAQEVEKVIPEAVGEFKDGYKSLINNTVYWTMLNAIKELREILCDLNPDNEICK